MRVLMTADTVGGVWTYALELADALAPTRRRGDARDDGRAARAVRSGRSSRRPRRRPRATSADYALEWMADPWERRRARGRLAARARGRASRPDLVH